MKWRIKLYNVIHSEENYLFLCGEKILAIFSESLSLTLYCFIPAIDFQGKYAVIE